MRRFFIGIIILVIVIAGFYILSSRKQSSPNSNQEKVETNKVLIKGYAYSPAVIKVKKGTTVTWENQDIVEHNVVEDMGQEPKGPLIGKGETYKFTFNKTGIYKYHCTPHPFMKGTVEVVE